MQLSTVQQLVRLEKFNMTIKEIATKILERRNSLSPIIMIGEMNQILGGDGLQEALARGWLIPDYYNGALQVTDYMTKVNEMRELAESGNYQVGDSVVVVEDGQGYTAVVQGKRSDGTYMLSFGDKKPRTERTYNDQEIKPVSRTEVKPNEPNRPRQEPLTPEKTSSAPAAPAGAAG